MESKGTCYHCGDELLDEQIMFDQKHFCCQGCKTVYALLSDNDFGQYYDLKEGDLGQTKAISKDFSYLDTEKFEKPLLLFQEGNRAKIKLYIPSIHCTACILLLENLFKLNDGIFNSKVNFLKKEIQIDFDKAKLPLSQLVQFLASLGYEPNLSLESIQEKSKPKESKHIWYRIGVAGFCFGNVMLLSFPDYLGLSFYHQKFADFFAYLNLIFSLPIVFYCAVPYFVSAYKGLKYKQLNLDVPIVIGITVLYLRSWYEILSGVGVGYIDSLSGFVFFLQLGKWYQKKTFDHLNFERDFKSFFPIAIEKKEGDDYKMVPVSEIQKGDIIRVKNGEVLPTDGKLLSDQTYLDYSFITGESDQVDKKASDYLYAGGKVCGVSTELCVEKSIDQSYLTDLWNNEAFEKSYQRKALLDKVSKHFTWVLILISSLTFAYWLNKDTSRAFEVFTSVLIVACPCALALTVPFTLGNSIRLLAQKGIYVKSTEVLEYLKQINHIVFDKTGTLTTSDSQLDIQGDQSDEVLTLVKTLANESSHPKSQLITSHLKQYSKKEISNVEEVVGEKIIGDVDGKHIELGRLKKGGGTVFSVDGVILSSFNFKHKLRSGIKSILQNLKVQFKLSLLSGDTDKEKYLFENILEYDHLKFEHSPQQKLDYIESLQKGGDQVMMIGDGLNDSGALKQSDIGMIVSDQKNSFNPACDIIVDEKGLKALSQFLNFNRKTISLVKLTFIVSILYNCVGLYFAISGHLSPLLSAILMPMSSVTIAILGVFGTNILSKISFKK